MAASGIISKAQMKRKRVSGRSIKFSKAMKVVDNATRKHFQDVRLAALEADAHEEQEQGDDDIYEEVIIRDGLYDYKLTRCRKTIIIHRQGQIQKERERMANQSG